MTIRNFFRSLFGGRDTSGFVSDILRGEFESPGARAAYANEQEWALFYAVARGDIATVQKTVSSNPAMVAAHGIGMQPLHRAAMDGRTEMAACLMSAGADVNAVDEMFGWTPLHYAAKNNQLAMVELLISRGADSKVRDDNGLTPLAVVRSQCGGKDGSQRLVDWSGDDYTDVARILLSDDGV